jgi:hypothetical protein
MTKNEVRSLHNSVLNEDCRSETPLTLNKAFQIERIVWTRCCIRPLIDPILARACRSRSSNHPHLPRHSNKARAKPDEIPPVRGSKTTQHMRRVVAVPSGSELTNTTAAKMPNAYARKGKKT